KIRRIVEQFRILLQVLLDVRMCIQEAIEVLELLPRNIASRTVEPLFTIHEDSWIFRRLRTDAWMCVEELFEFRMRGTIRRIVEQFRILLQVLLDVRMRIQEAIEVLQLLARDIATRTVEPLFTIHEAPRVFAYLFAYAWVRA